MVDCYSDVLSAEELFQSLFVFGHSSVRVCALISHFLVFMEECRLNLGVFVGKIDKL